MKDKFVLDYSDYSLFNVEYGMNRHGSKAEYFHGKKGWCPFCRKDVKVEYNRADSFTYDFGPWREITEVVYQCECGWWQIDYYSYIEETNHFKDWHKSVYSAQLKKYTIGDKDIPLDSLRSFLERNESKIYEINDKKMEQLVASVFREHFQCEVREVGKSHDGGIDLIMIDSDSPTIIQVKRRKSSKKTESVKEIRDVLGATLLSDSKKCIFVTTADHFSREAVNSRNVAIEKSIVESFELYDYRRFLNMMQLHRSNKSQEWKKYLKFDKNIPRK